MKDDLKPTGDEPADRGPGAQSGHEDLPHERVIPGMGSAAEGYDNAEPSDGTRSGNPIAGVELDPGTTPARPDGD
ncbi:hypothetical protein [Actinomadura parmotrematis]|uniref:Uncharacterized protein n=1 Tax=Actinomadura parmotrematis TaxID=2864039 RepID=A0ABS7G1M5_9ACTN|nr:hypothetical protein [Actinomadura parmotrematis]MBW8486598.1 hypothetical protein [Actinomadura parmotrematis]